VIDQDVADAAVIAVRAGDTVALGVLLEAHPDLATMRLPGHGPRTMLHVATDWPGHFPNVARTVALLAAAGADPDAPFIGPHTETPLHWAASSGDVEAMQALLAAGADVNAPGAVIGGGTPMADATAFGQWAAAACLLAHGARTNLFEAASLGLVDRVAQRLGHDVLSPVEVTSAFWGACHGGQRSTAQVLLERGADLNWVGYDGLTPLDAAERSGATDLIEWLAGCGAMTGGQIASDGL
jgi:ankyrin repeat protein